MLDLFDDSDFGFSDSERDESEEGDEERVYSYHGKPNTDATELTFIKASVEGSSSILFRTCRVELRRFV